MVTSFKNKRKSAVGKYLLLYGGALLVLGILIILVVANVRMYHKRKEFLSQIQNLQNQIKDIQERNDHLHQGILRADDNQYIEKVAREELDLQQPGETAVSFIMPLPKEVKPDARQKNNWLAWIGNALHSLMGK